MIWLAAASALASSGRVEIDAAQLGAKVPKSLYGVFLEEINNSGEGGLYAELIQNRGFEDANVPPGCTVNGRTLFAPKNPSFWEGYSKNFQMEWPYDSTMPFWSVQGLQLSTRITDAHPLTPASPHALEFTSTAVGGRIVNDGFWGIGVKMGAAYRLSLHAQSLGYTGSLTARLVGQDGKVLASAPIRSIPSGKWGKLSANLTATGSDSRAKFELVVNGKGKGLIDFVSLFPAKTFKNRPNGLRPDLAKMIADLKPAFVRWPGGCVVEGITIETRPRWEQTLGPIETRTPTFIPWGYWVSNGFGYHEWLQFCEDIGAEPLYVFSVGVSCAFRSGTYLPDSETPNLIQNTLDAIEYAIGPTTSKWGGLRAKNGHPKPFPMRTIEIGNEEQGAKYGARVAQFIKPIKAKYPQLKIALSSWISGIDHAAIDAAGPGLDIVDEHAYKPIHWAVNNFDSFAKYPRNVPWELYIGEFATNSGVGRGNMLATIGDAAYMMNMEKNGDLVKMGSYAPLLENTNRRQWEVNLIHFDTDKLYGRASYYACKLFAENLPTVNLATKVDFTPTGENPIHGPIGLGIFGTTAEFKDIQVEQDGKSVYRYDPSAPGKGWQIESGQWVARDGVYAQTGPDFDVWSRLPGDYKDTKVSFKARRLSGAEGFVVSVGNADGRRVQFNVGGWNNTQHTLEVAGQVIKAVRTKAEDGRWYDVEVETRGRHVTCKLDGKVLFDEELPRIDKVLAVAGRDDATGDIIVKVLNPTSAPVDLDLALQNAALTGKGTVTTLASENPEAENSYEKPNQIVPTVTPISFSGDSLKRRFPAYSVSIVRVKTR